MEIEEVSSYEALPLLSLNHVSLLCRSVWDSVRFYEDILGFVLIKRPSSFNFNGAWLAFQSLSFILFLCVLTFFIHLLEKILENPLNFINYKEKFCKKYLFAVNMPEPRAHHGALCAGRGLLYSNKGSFN